MSEVYFFQIKYEKMKARFAYGFIDTVIISFKCKFK